jgi:ubiquinone/menaquinone biosynthesis C-methylase UbiE
MSVNKDPEKSERVHLLKYADFTGMRVLELGCGEGRLTWRYADRAARVAGIDLDRDALRLATIERPSDLAQSVSFLQANSIRLPFRDEAFEGAIFAWSF